MFLDKGLESIFISPNMFGALFTITLVWLLVLYFLLIMNSKFFSVYLSVTFDFVGHIQFTILSTSISRLPQKKVPWSLLGPILTLPCS